VFEQLKNEVAETKQQVAETKKMIAKCEWTISRIDQFDNSKDFQETAELNEAKLNRETLLNELNNILTPRLEKLLDRLIISEEKEAEFEQQKSKQAADLEFQKLRTQETNVLAGIITPLEDEKYE